MEENENDIDSINEKKNEYILLLYTILLVLSFSIRKPEKRNIEMKIERFIKHKEHKYIYYQDFEKELPSINIYIKSLRENLTNNANNYSEILKPKISFIASVYNKEKYLPSFISSIQNQLLKEFEIILVDDCSIDKSIKVINEFKNKDQRIKLIKINLSIIKVFKYYWKNSIPEKL